jgi:agmatinase
VAEALDASRLPVVLGGDHSVPFGALKAAAERRPGLGVLHLDAHADLREAYEGFTWSHASIFFNGACPASRASCRSACATSARASAR